MPSCLNDAWRWRRSRAASVSSSPFPPLARTGMTIFRSSWRSGGCSFIAPTMIGLRASFRESVNMPGTMFSTEHWMRPKLARLRALMSDPHHRRSSRGAARCTLWASPDGGSHLSVSKGHRCLSSQASGRDRSRSQDDPLVDAAVSGGARSVERSTRSH
jgi:hypothetical protein